MISFLKWALSLEMSNYIYLVMVVEKEPKYFAVKLLVMVYAIIFLSVACGHCRVQFYVLALCPKIL